MDERPPEPLPETVLDLLAPQPGMRCLTLGPVTSNLVEPLADQLDPGSVVALDRGRQAVQRDQRAGYEGRVVGVRGAPSKLPFLRASFARIVVAGLPHEDQQGAAVTEIVRVLEQGGRMLVLDADHRKSGDLEDAGFAQVDEHGIGAGRSALLAVRSTRP